MDKHENYKVPFTEYMVPSGAAAALAKTAAAPIERVKLLMQNQNEMLKQGTIKRPYEGIIDCTRLTLNNEGVISFWRGKICCHIMHTFKHKFRLNLISILAYHVFMFR